MKHGMEPRHLVEGPPGHPAHPPLTDAVIGTLTFATIAALLDVLGIVEENAARAWSIAVIVGLVLAVPTALTGLLDYLKIERGTPLKRTATLHLGAMVVALVLFLIGILVGYGEAADGAMTTLATILTLAGFVVMLGGGWLGGSIVFVHGMRVLSLVEEPARRAASPAPTPEERAAERG